MSAFRWRRDGIAITSTCTLCGLASRSLSESAIYLQQRDHDAMTCQMQRAETARALATEAFLATITTRKPSPRLLLNLTTTTTETEPS